MRGYARLDTWTLTRPKDKDRRRVAEPPDEHLGVDTAQKHGGPLDIGQMLR